MKAFNHLINTRTVVVFFLFHVATTYCLYGQDTVYPYFYRVYFNDKGDNNISGYSALDLLSQRAINRRQKEGILVPDFKDLPVNKSYLDKILLLGLKLHTTSKWMNTALFKSQSAFDINKLLILPFVSNVKTVKIPGKKSEYSNKLDFHITIADLPPYDRPLTMINGDQMHISGYTGKNILIAVLDGGFLNTDLISSLNSLRSRNGIRTTYDFVKNKKSVYDTSTHGTAVLSVLAGMIPGQIEGMAPGADYLLLKTEDIASEFPCEEDFWAAGAEYADSSGVDIISSSLGYFNFDDPTLNYKYSDLDGNTAFVTRAADIAASKGILVVNSAGNERNNTWKRIIFPSDGDSVVAAGAVDGNGFIADFSSTGPSSDNRIKPDNVAMGVNVAVQISENLIGRANGASFSCPVLSGISACLMQAVPNALSIDIVNALHSCGNRYSNPDSLYGYGIPGIVIALNTLQSIYVKSPDNAVLIFPNPTTGIFDIIFPSPPENITIELISISGKLMVRKKITGYAGRTMKVTELLGMNPGVYLLRIASMSGIITRKVIKIKNK
jgi:serine protease AprX